MSSTGSQTALLYFSRTPGAESAHKVLHAGGRKSNQKVIEILHSNALLAANRSGLDVVHISEDRQTGITFGDRLANAFQLLFDVGFDRVIAIGNDCPELGTVNWKEVNDLLSDHQAVLGPTPAGGTYLIGLDKEVFSHDQFAGLPWKSSDLFKSLLRHLGGSQVNAACLIPKADLNNTADVQRFLRFTNGRSNSLQQTLSKLYENPATASYTLKLIEAVIRQGFSIRPPPALLKQQ